MAKSPEINSSGESGKYVHSIELWGMMMLDDLEVESAEAIVELRRRYEQKHAGQHMEPEQFRAWLRLTAEHNNASELTPEWEDELARRYDLPQPGEDGEIPPPQDSALDIQPEHSDT